MLLVLLSMSINDVATLSSASETNALWPILDSQKDTSTWHPQQIRLLYGTNCCMIESDGGPEEESGREGSGAGDVREEQRFQVLAAEAAEGASGDPLLVLRTNRGQVELSPPGRDDRDSMLIGFELLLASFEAGGAGDGRGDTVKPSTFEGEEGSARGGFPDGNVARRRSKRWEGEGGREDMVLESSEDDSSSDGGQHQHRR